MKSSYFFTPVLCKSSWKSVILPRGKKYGIFMVGWGKMVDIIFAASPVAWSAWSGYRACRFFVFCLLVVSQLLDLLFEESNLFFNRKALQLCFYSPLLKGANVNIGVTHLVYSPYIFFHMLFIAFLLFSFLLLFLFFTPFSAIAAPVIGIWCLFWVV